MSQAASFPRPFPFLCRTTPLSGGGQRQEGKQTEIRETGAFSLLGKDVEEGGGVKREP